MVAALLPEERLVHALDRLATSVEVWWRDDDAGRPSPRLTRLRSIAAARRAPLGLAVVPAWLDAGVASQLRGDPNVEVLQHGWAHENHAQPEEKKVELGGSETLDVLEKRLRVGLGLLREQLGDRFRPVLVPPWNRIAPQVVGRLGAIGYAGLSTFGPMKAARQPGLAWVNTHLDLVHWGGRTMPLTFTESVERLVHLVGNVRLLRVGLLTHHLVMDEPAFDALDRLLGILLDHPRVVWRAPHELFGLPA